jgi:hypothetical protein
MILMMCLGGWYLVGLNLLLEDIVLGDSGGIFLS